MSNTWIWKIIEHLQLRRGFPGLPRPCWAVQRPATPRGQEPTYKANVATAAGELGPTGKRKTGNTTTTTSSAFALITRVVRSKQLHFLTFCAVCALFKGCLCASCQPNDNMQKHSRICETNSNPDRTWKFLNMRSVSGTTWVFLAPKKPPNWPPHCDLEEPLLFKPDLWQSHHGGFLDMLHKVNL